MGKSAAVWILATAALVALGSRAIDNDREYLASAIVTEHESPDPANRFFALTVASDTNGADNGGVPTIGLITPKESKLAEWLAAHDGQRIALSARAGGLLTRDGQ